MSTDEEDCANIPDLVALGADVNELMTIDGHVATPLHMACAKHLFNNVKTLLQCGANPNMKDLDGFKPLHYLFLSSVNNVDTFNIASDTVRYLNNVLRKTKVRGKFDEIKDLLLKFGAEGIDNDAFWTYLYQLQCRKGSTSLILAVQLRHAPMSFIQHFIDNCSQVNAKGRKGETALAIAAAAGRDDVVKVLIDRGADVNSQDLLGNTALHHTCDALFSDSENLKCLELLLTHGADTNPQQARRQSPLALAVKKGWLGGVKCVISHGADINARIHDPYQSVLMLAAEVKWLEGVQYLINHGADINARDGNRRLTVLMLAVDVKWLTGVQYLINHGADINIKRNIRGQTALMLAAENEWLDGVRYLVNNGADINVRDRRDRTALDYSGNQGVREYLRAKGGTSGRERRIYCPNS